MAKKGGLGKGLDELTKRYYERNYHRDERYTL